MSNATSVWDENAVRPHAPRGNAPLAPCGGPFSDQVVEKGSASLQRRSFRTSKRCCLKRQLAPCAARMLRISTYGGALHGVFQRPVKGRIIPPKECIETHPCSAWRPTAPYRLTAALLRGVLE